MATSPYEIPAIFNLQHYLRELARFHPAIPMVDEDGIFGEETRAALMAFQSEYGLPVTGTADPVTWALLFDEYLTTVEAHTRPDPVYVFPRYPLDYSVGRGDENLLVALIQLILRDTIILYGFPIATEILPINGRFDELTEQNVQNFQRVQHLPPNGRVDRTTWNRLVRAQAPRVNRFPQE